MDREQVGLYAVLLNWMRRKREGKKLTLLNSTTLIVGTIEQPLWRAEFIQGYFGILLEYGAHI